MKKFFSLFATLTFVFVLVGCGGGGKPSTNPIEDFGDDYKNIITADITFWHAMGQKNQAVIDEIITEFNKEYPNIHVEHANQGGYTDLRDKILTTLASGNSPTIAQTYPDHVAAYMQGRAVRELNSYVNHERYGMTKEDLSDFIEAYYKEGTTYDTKGTLYSLPFNKSTEVVFYNKTWFMKEKIEGVSLYEKYNLGTIEMVDDKPVGTDLLSARLTWEDIVEISEYYINSEEYSKIDVAKKGEYAGFAADSEANLFITLTQQFGGVYTSLKAPHYVFDNPESKAAIGWFAEKVERGIFGTATKFGADYSSDAFTAQKVKITLGSSAGANYNYPQDGSFEVGVIPYPQFKDAPVERQQVIQQGTNVTLFKRTNPTEELAGWLFMRFLTGPKAAMIWATKTGYFPIRLSVRDSDEYNDFLTGRRVVLDGEGNLVELFEPTFIAQTMKVGWEQRNLFYTSPAFPGSSDARDEVERLIQAVLYNNVSIEDAYTNALRELNK